MLFGRAGAFLAILLDAMAQEARPGLVAGLAWLAGAGLRSRPQQDSTGLEDVDGAEPVFYAGGPGGDGPIGLGTEAVAVAAFGVDVQFSGNFGCFEG